MAAPPDAIQKWRPLFDPLQNFYGNLVTPLIDGSETYEAMYRALLTACSKGHYIYLLGWSCDERLGLQADKKGNRAASTSLEAVLKRTSRDVQIRVMLWRQSRIMGGTYLKDTKRAIRAINRLPNAAAIRDWRLPLHRLSHHQKVLIVNGTDGVIAFCGGLDIYPDRVLAMGDGSPQHDVHCRVQGPSCLGLIDVFDQRWRSHPKAQKIDQKKGPLVWRNGTRIFAKGSAYVRVTRTFNCVLPKPSNVVAGSDEDALIGDLDDDVDDDEADVNADRADDLPEGDPSDPQVLKTLAKRACKKERSIADVLFTAINKAEKFIYVEEQYMIDLKVAEALNKVLNNGIDITFLIPGSAISSNNFNKRRKDFINTVLKKGPTQGKGKRGSFHVFYLVDPKTGTIGEHCYVHAKTWVFDDEMAIIGSANTNRRGLSSDSEANVNILDAPFKGDSIAKALRKRLWAEHLGVEEKDVDDPAKSAELWLKKRKTSRVREYDPNKAKDPGPGGGNLEMQGVGTVDPDLDGLPWCQSNCC